MLWRLEQINSTFIDAFEEAGEPDQAVITAYVAQHGQHPPKHAGIKRWYYFLKDNHRIRLTTVGRPLDDWAGAAKIIVGTGEIIGESTGNRDLVGQVGLKLQFEPIAWLQGRADKTFVHGEALLAEISEQILDRKVIEQSQRSIRAKYQYRRR
jgi:hypothetical protein